ncbi:MAG: MFS transporter [Candidatus Tectomicrobia bacterium]|uniref:MFS transporter n=1 Tax=Tectimicrobiota bacterium TaxID=2528274 RepID=A0A932MPL8_UNCTE|nr:MFS transporter [Candidatus Tectomicrobia bacterium]
MDAKKKFNLFALSASHGLNSFYMYLLIPVLPLIVKEYDLSYVEAGILVSAYSLSNSLFQFPFSFLADYTGRWRTVLALSHLIQALPVLFYAYAGSYRLLLLLGFISGLGSAAYHPPAVSLITRELPGRRGFTMAIFNGGGDVGHIVTPALVGWLTAYLMSWQAAVQVLVLPGLVWAALIWLRFRDQGSQGQAMRQAARSTIGALFRNRRLMLLVTLSTFRITGFRGLMTFLPLLLTQSFGYDVRQAGWILSGYFVLGTVATLFVGQWSDRLGGNRTIFIVVMTFMTAAALSSLSWVNSVPALLLAVASVGVLLTPVPSLVLAVGTELVEERQRSSSVGLIYGMNEGASTLSPIIGGLVAQSFGLRLVFLFYALMFAAGGVVAILLHRERLRPQAKLAGETA